MLQWIGAGAVGEKCHSSLWNFNEPCPWCIHQKVMEGNNVNIEVTCPNSNKAFLVSNSPIHHADGSISKLTVFRDITEARNMEKQIRQSQKMEAIGTLAGGIAHDFNNILTAVIGYNELLQMSLSKDSVEFEYTEYMEQAGNRARDLVNQILTFSRQTEHECRPVDIGIIVKEVAKLLRSSLPTTIEVRHMVSPNALVMADPTQIHQVLMNLCTNAGHAMKKNGGLLSIELECIELVQELVNDRVKLDPGNYIRLTVSDTGHGIPAQIIDRIFDPFFTTKELGEGTGMGLPVVHGIIKKCNGAIYVYSEEGQGTTFKVYLPAIEKPDESIRHQNEEIPKGHEHILLVDDEIALTHMGTFQLKELGYQVTTRNSGRDALELFISKPDAFDLVITDVTMPKMTGDELAREIKQIRPDIPVIMCTGFSLKFNSDNSLPPGVDAFLMKPVIIREMAQIIRKMLDK